MEAFGQKTRSKKDLFQLVRENVRCSQRIEATFLPPVKVNADNYLAAMNAIDLGEVVSQP